MFEINTGVTRAGADEYRVRGDLTIRGVTTFVTLVVTYEGQITDHSGVQRAGFAAETAISRKAFGLSWNALLYPSHGETRAFPAMRPGDATLASL